MNFTLEAILAARAKAKSGADFPQVVKDLIALGVEKYDYFVEPGVDHYYSKDGKEVISPENPVKMKIHPESSSQKLEEIIRDHQAGKTNFAGFRERVAGAGVEWWRTDFSTMLITYYNPKGELMVTEPMPQ